MPLHLAYVTLFLYFCVVCKNSDFCYYIFSHNSFNFSLEDRSMCESYAMQYTKNLRKQVYTLLLFCVTTLCDTWKCVLHATLASQSILLLTDSAKRNNLRSIVRVLHRHTNLLSNLQSQSTVFLAETFALLQYFCRLISQQISPSIAVVIFTDSRSS